MIGGRIIDAGINLAETRLSDRITNLTKTVDARLQAVDEQLASVHKRVEERITTEFEEPRIRETVEGVAQAAAARVIAEHVEPAEKTVALRLRNFENFLDTRQERLDSHQAAFRAELDVLKKRNSLTRLADRAIGSDTNLEDYKRLLQMFDEETDPDLKAAENAEIYRVIDAYGMLAPSRVPNITLQASTFNPEKKDESELTSEELLIALNNRESLVRARAAFLLESRPPTFHVARMLKDALESELNLEALRYEKRAFSHASGFSSKGRLDATDELKWWSDNAERLEKELPK